MHVVQLADTADVKLERCQSKGGCWLWIWFLLSRFNNILAITIFKSPFNQPIHWQISNFDKLHFTPKRFIYFFCKMLLPLPKLRVSKHVCKLCFKYVGFNFYYCVFNNFMIHLTTHRLRYSNGKITKSFF